MKEDKVFNESVEVPLDSKEKKILDKFDKLGFRIWKIQKKQEKLLKKLGLFPFENAKVYSFSYDEEKENLENAIQKKDIEGIQKALRDNFVKRMECCRNKK